MSSGDSRRMRELLRELDEAKTRERQALELQRQALAREQQQRREKEQAQAREQQQRREKEQAQAREQQQRREKEQAQAREQQQRREKEQAQAREQQQRREKEQAQAREQQARAQVQPTTLQEFLRDNHLYGFKALRLADDTTSSLGNSTAVKGKFYPLWLRRWEGFRNLQREHFDKILRACGNDRLFNQSLVTRAMSNRASRDPAAYENDIEIFERVGIEGPVRDIFEGLKETNLSKEINFSGMLFSNNHRMLKRQGGIDTGGSEEDPGDKGASKRVQGPPQRTEPNKRLAKKRKVSGQNTYPDGWGGRDCPKEELYMYPHGKLATFIYDYKAGHKLPVENLKRALANEKLFMEVVDRSCREKIRVDSRERDAADEQVAKALTQVFDYMVTFGVKYGYVAAGESLVFLYTDLKHPRTLYYDLCLPNEQAEDDVASGTCNIFHTAVAQLASFCLLSFRSEPILGRDLPKLVKDAKLQRWNNPYEESAHLLGPQSVDSSQSPPSQETTGSLYGSQSRNVAPAGREMLLRSRATCRDPAAGQKKKDDSDDEEQDDDRFRSPEVLGPTSAKKRKEGPSSGGSEGGNKTPSESSPTKQYCTQACLLGLKMGWDLDEKCPNVSCHRTGSTRHAINATEFASLVGEQLRQDPYQKCVSLDPYGSSGKTGAIGMLFKLELARYGYTFVAKGTQSAQLRHLQHENLVYSRLERLQGEVVPVCLGVVDVARGYFLPGGARVFHMMLMSWGGEVAAETRVPDIAAELERSLRAVRQEGVIHGDERKPNILWNKERRRVMLIDFDRATLQPVVKHKQVSKLSDKRKLQGNFSNLFSIRHG